ncbi:aminotransferase [Leucobacter sp. GX24907]
MVASSTGGAGGLVRPDISETDAERIALELYGVRARATELGSNQDRNFVLAADDGTRSVLRVDNPVFGDDARAAQHLAIDAYRAAGLTVPAVLPGLDGNLTQRWGGFAVRRSEFADGEAMVDAGYFAPVVLEEFGALAAASVNALTELEHPGLDREHMWVMSAAHDETMQLSSAIADERLRDRVLTAAAEAQAALAPVQDVLPVQPIHGDLTDDNVMGLRSDDARLHPRTIIDLGDLAYGWRVSELAVAASSMLHHEPDRPLRVLDTIAAFHRAAPLSAAEARAVWPLVVLRGAILVASGWRQLEIDGGNDYARERVAGEQAIFDAATALPLAEMTEHVLARLGFVGVPEGAGLALVAAPAMGDPASNTANSPAAAVASDSVTSSLARLLPDLDGGVVMLDPGVESEDLASGRWTEPGAEHLLVQEAFRSGAGAAVLPYGVYRLTRTVADRTDAAETWPLETEIRVRAGSALRLMAPAAGRVAIASPGTVTLQLSAHWLMTIVAVDSDGGPLLTPAVDGRTIHSGAEVGVGDPLGELGPSASPRSLTVGLFRLDAMLEILAEGPAGSGSTPGRAQLVAPERVPAWRRFTLDPARLLGLEPRAERDESGDEQLRRERIFASAQERYYERPMQIERGWQHHLIDTTGRAYVDMINNVAGLGHGHPGVADAVNRQIRILNTNSRFLYRELADYSERLLALLPDAARTGGEGGDPLDTVLLVNSGSEAVDLALRLAQAATGRKTVVALREAYHGWTMASDAVTTSAFDNPRALEDRPDWIHVADVPNRFRGTHRGEASDATVGARYAADLGADLDRLAGAGRDVAGFICESVLGNAGGVLLPEGYLADVYGRVRAAGGLCIADEVQVGFGRMGSTFWGFEQSGVMPDIITIAKPMGNGFPIGGVITSQRIADALATHGQFFSSAGGNPLSCRVGLAVLDAMEREGLQENAREVGDRLASGFRALAARHSIIGPVHGTGLYLGVELVRDHETWEPATAEAAAICERLRELGVIVQTTSERSNVLKVKPPLCLTPESADFVVEQLDRVLTTGW